MIIFVMHAIVIPTPMPMKERPVVARSKPCFSTKIIGKAWNARYSIPNRNEALVMRETASTIAAGHYVP